MASLVTITLDYRGGQSGPFEVAGRATYTVVAAIQSAVSRILHPIGAFGSGLAHVGSLRSENQALKQRIRTLETRVGRNASLARVNAELTKLINLEQTLKLSGKPARVTAESVGNFEWSVTIDKGSSSGVKMNMPVVAGAGPGGHVGEATPSASKVPPIIDPNSAVGGRPGKWGGGGVGMGAESKEPATVLG